jgi:hypothetical protein
LNGKVGLLEELALQLHTSYLQLLLEQMLTGLAVCMCLRQVPSGLGGHHNHPCGHKLLTQPQPWLLLWCVTPTGTFAFIETYAVPFFAQSTASWITYGTLTSDAGLSATLMYGFAAPDGQNLMMAGSLQGAVRDR